MSILFRIQSTCNKHEERCDTSYKADQRYQTELFSEVSSICSYPYKHHQSDISTSADETTDNDNAL